MTAYDDDGCVAVGERGLWVHRLSRYKVGGSYGWEYVGVEVIEKIVGQRTTWLRVRRLKESFIGPAGEVVKVVARQIYGEEAARRWHPKEAAQVWGRETRGETKNPGSKTDGNQET